MSNSAAHVSLLPGRTGRRIRNVSSLRHCCYCSALAGREERMSARVSRNKTGNLCLNMQSGRWLSNSVKGTGNATGETAGLLQDIQGPGTRLDHQLAAQQPAHTLPCKHEDQSSISRTHTKKLGAVGCPCNPNNSKIEGGEREIPKSLQATEPGLYGEPQEGFWALHPTLSADLHTCPGPWPTTHTKKNKSDKWIKQGSRLRLGGLCNVLFSMWTTRWNYS